MYTEKTEDVLYKIVKYCKLEPDSYEKNKVSERDPLDIYREIKRQYLEWDKPKKFTLILPAVRKQCQLPLRWPVQ